jgi:hypothetical protein
MPDGWVAGLAVSAHCARICSIQQRIDASVQLRAINDWGLDGFFKDDKPAMQGTVFVLKFGLYSALASGHLGLLVRNQQRCTGRGSLPAEDPLVRPRERYASVLLIDIVQCAVAVATYFLA